MPNNKRTGRPEPEPLDLADPVEEEEPEDLWTAESFEVHHATCPDCSQSIALVADEEFLPEHALCLTPWNPFGLTVCPGTGRPASPAPGADSPAERELEPVVLLTLPQGLDWRTQPFSHVGGPGSRPRRPERPAPVQSRHAQAA
ncbi:hypothetical protein LG634_10475 [Streptomyces bambusae]|uniref:hypothetical protein n=1 Tax=Streptomyces bambusae TaxID=1550616 RepID=UPI001CFDE7A5|nr:hypothetical protein [Streptomyces bambusae]MCB5165252.1 hypothetical protein [Streptomyces bambusae]